jgi:hypothetical protein
MSGKASAFRSISKRSQPNDHLLMQRIERPRDTVRGDCSARAAAECTRSLPLPWLQHALRALRCRHQADHHGGLHTFSPCQHHAARHRRRTAASVWHATNVKLTTVGTLAGAQPFYLTACRYDHPPRSSSPVTTRSLASSTVRPASFFLREGCDLCLDFACILLVCARASQNDKSSCAN